MLLLAGALSGCVETTQQKNARAQQRDDRILATRNAVEVSRSDPDIAVLNVMMLRRRAGTAIAVTLRNDGGKPVSDLAINVGVRTAAGATRYLNQAELPYFQTHVGGVAAGARTTWVFTTASTAPAGRAFARVGAPTVHLGSALALPAISLSATAVRTQGRAASTVGAQIRNRSGVPQDELQAYAYAISRGRLIAAGTAPLGGLGPKAAKALRLRLIGNPGSSPVHIETPPTNLR